MASRIGVASSRQATVRPVFERAMSPASASTPRCFMIAGSEIENGAASAVIEISGSSASRMTIARRVGSASAAKVRSSVSLLKLTIWFSIDTRGAVSIALPAREGGMGIAPAIQAFLNVKPAKSGYPIHMFLNLEVIIAAHGHEFHLRVHRRPGRHAPACRCGAAVEDA